MEGVAFRTGGAQAADESGLFHRRRLDRSRAAEYGGRQISRTPARERNNGEYRVSVSVNPR